MASDFHFMSPAWLLALIPLAALLWWVARRDAGTDAWRRVMDPRLLAVLSVGSAAGRRLPLILLGAGALLAVIALANPTFERRPTPAFRSDAPRVIVLDLSRSMEAADLTPSRLLRARYKVDDILVRSADGQAALIAFAGAPFAVAPLSDDTKTIAALLDALAPEVMPVQGSRVDLAIAAAQDLLTQAGALAGEVVLLTDDAGDERALAAARALADAGHRLAVIGVGTADGAAVPGVQSSGGPIIAKVDADALRRLAGAGGGRFSPLTPSGRDLDRVLSPPGTLGAIRDSDDPRLAETWHELGPWITLLLLPLGALAFRRGWVGLLALAMPLWLAEPTPALAFGWDDLWQRRDQQAAAALAEDDPARALTLAEDPARRGTASFRLGDYATAAAAFAAGSEGADHYNRGNALALGGRLDEALAAYDQAIERVGADAALGADIRYNRARVEDLLKQQQQQQQPGGGESQDQDQTQGQSGGEQDASASQQDQGGEQPTGSDGQGQDRDQQSAGQGGENGSDGQSAADQAPGGGEQASGDGRQADPSQGQDRSDSSEQDAQSGQDQPRDPAGPDTGSAADAPSDHDANRGAQDTRGDPSQAGQADGETQPRTPDQAQTEQAAADYREAADAAQALQAGQPEPADQAAQDADGQIATLGPEEREARRAAEQWLRRIPDDPGGLLRRKFLYQYRQRATEDAGMDAGNPW